MRRYAIKKEGDIDTEKEKLKQRIQAKTRRIKRFVKRRKQFQQNRIFNSNPKVFYRELGYKQPEVNEPPPLDEIETFWKIILEDDKHHNDAAEWIRKQEEIYDNSPLQEWKDITMGEVTAALRRSSNWKSSGIDKVPNVWLKNCESLHEDLARCYSEMVREPDRNPTWLTQGMTYLLPKTQETNNPKTTDQSRACLPHTNINMNHCRQNLQPPGRKQFTTNSTERM